MQLVDGLMFATVNSPAAKTWFMLLFSAMTKHNFMSIRGRVRIPKIRCFWLFLTTEPQALDLPMQPQSTGVPAAFPIHVFLSSCNSNFPVIQGKFITVFLFTIYRTIFTGIKRYHYIDPTYAFTVEEEKQRQQHKQIYINFISRLRWKRQQKIKERYGVFCVSWKLNYSRSFVKHFAFVF